MSKRIALFAGSFDPYTNGHHAVVRKATALFDEVVVLIGVNVNKRRAFDAGAMRLAIQETIDADGLNARAVIHTGLVADYCAEHGIHWYVRGLRNAGDYSYEEGNAQVNRLLNPGLESRLRAPETSDPRGSDRKSIHSFQWLDPKDGYLVTKEDQEELLKFYFAPHLV